MSWEKAYKRVHHRSAYKDLQRSCKKNLHSVVDQDGKERAQQLFGQHITMLREKMGATAEDIAKAEEEARKQEELAGHDSSNSVDDDENKADGEKRKKRKKSSHKKKKSHKSDKKRARRSSSHSSE